jgi:hypothetical protein
MARVVRARVVQPCRVDGAPKRPTSPRLIGGLRPRGSGVAEEDQRTVLGTAGSHAPFAENLGQRREQAHGAAPAALGGPPLARLHARDLRAPARRRPWPTTRPAHRAGSSPCPVTLRRRDARRSRRRRAWIPLAASPDAPRLGEAHSRFAFALKMAAHRFGVFCQECALRPSCRNHARKRKCGAQRLPRLRSRGSSSGRPSGVERTEVPAARGASRDQRNSRRPRAPRGRARRRGRATGSPTGLSATDEFRRVVTSSTFGGLG